MFLYISEWTSKNALAELDKKGFPHSERLFKVFTTNLDPSEIIGKNLALIEGKGDTFTEDYKYPGRGPWLAEDLENYITHFHLTKEATKSVRALFRFAHDSRLEIDALAMSVRNTFRRYEHPLAIVDGLDKALNRGRYHGLHLDIFTQRSVDRLNSIVDLNYAENVASRRESVIIARNQEALVGGKERA